MLKTRMGVAVGPRGYRSSSYLLPLGSWRALRVLVSAIGACTGDIHDQLQRPALGSARDRPCHLAGSVVRPQRQHHHPGRRRARPDYLASALTRISEDAWDAAAFLDASPALELAISALIEQLRGPADKIEPVSIPGDGYRHAGQWSFTDAAEVLASDAPAALSTLTRPQRLTVADELAADAAERASAAQVLASGNDPASEALAGVADVRGHQVPAQRPGRAAAGRGRRLAGPLVGAGPRPGRAVGGPRPAGAHRAARRGVQGTRRAGRDAG